MRAGPMLEALRNFIRPLAVTALITVLLAGAVVSGVLEVFLPGRGVAFTIGVAGWFKAIPDAYYELALAGLLGYAAARTIEKTVATHSTAKYNPPARAEVDDPDLPQPEFGKEPTR